MKISYNWLKKYIDLTESPQQIADLLTSSGLEVESVSEYESIKGGLKGLVIGKVLTCEKHPGADKLKKTTVDIGNGIIVPVVCGAPNVEAGQKVIVATVGATLYPSEGEPIKISKAKIRGEISEGMICAPDEIGIGHSHEGILVLDTLLPEGTAAAVFFDIQTDHIFEIGLTPNRADAASHLGVARDLRALLKRPLSFEKEIKDFKEDNNLNPVEIIVEDFKACPRYSGLTISNLVVKESPDWLKNHLRSIGLSPINNVVDITNYMLHDLGQPLHAFDLDEVEGKKVIVKTLPAGTEFVTLDGEKRKLQGDDLMISNSKEAMCIAGVFGGIKSGVSAKTKNIFLESAYFSADTIRKTAMHHGLKTDASFRFERGTDPEMPLYALQKAAMLIKEVAGGSISSKPIDLYPQKVEKFKIETSYKYIDRLIGKKIEHVRIKEILTNLEIEIASEKGDTLILYVPSFKVDVQREADIVEEILRIYGYDNIETQEILSTSYLADFPSKDKEKLQSRTAHLLAADGYSEIINNSLTKQSYSKIFETGETVEILNKLSEDLGVMRENLLFTGLETLAHNINRRQKDLKLFEFGKSYHKVAGKYIEKNRLAIFLTGNKTQESWISPSDKSGFFELKSTIVRVLSKLRIEGYTLEKAEDKFFGNGVVLKKNEKVTGSFGSVKNEFLKLLDIKQQVWMADFDWDLVVKQYKSELTYEEVSKYPEVRRDLSLVLDKRVNFSEISRLAMDAERKLLKNINVFDVYEGENIGKDKKSYSISFFLEDKEQTLTDKTIDKTMEKLIALFEKHLGAVIRK
ncbi:MAG TPA: phenylalanine--tRNA ligase subunit beta [Cytophagaceae bacterium]|nr:phenylalanine--tRNA ligase subunit beta [Cytophagaceae bacterium]